MKQIIYKYPIEFSDRFTIDLPVGAKILTVQNQNDSIYLWAIVSLDEEAPTRKRKFVLLGTGHPFEGISDMQYIGTFQLREFVGHLFETQ